MSWIQTYTGERFLLIAPHQGHVWLADIAHALAQQCRFNGHTRTFYSVAQHSLLVASLAPDELRLEALLHDAAEAYLGDIVTPLKHFLEHLSPGFAGLEKGVLGAIHRRFGLGCQWPSGLAQVDSTVKQADRLALAIERRDLFYDELDWDAPLPAPPGDVTVHDCWPAEKAEICYFDAVAALLTEKHQYLAPDSFGEPHPGRRRTMVC